jgi:hypothetical protein
MYCFFLLSSLASYIILLYPVVNHSKSADIYFLINLAENRPTFQKISKILIK